MNDRGNDCRRKEDDNDESQLVLLHCNDVDTGVVCVGVVVVVVVLSIFRVVGVAAVVEVVFILWLFCAVLIGGRVIG